MAAAESEDRQREVLFEFIRTSSHGVTSDDLRARFKERYEAMVTPLQHLLDRHMVEVVTLDNGTLAFVAVDEERAGKMATLSSEERAVLRAVEDAGSDGIWTKIIKSRTKLQQTDVARCLRKLERKNLIKSVRSVAHKNRKMYMGFEVEPSRDLTGGPWYTDQELDAAFIKGMRGAVFQIIQTSKQPTRAEICSRIAAAGVSKVPLSSLDIQQIIDTLIYDGAIDIVPSVDDDGASDDGYEDDGFGGAAAGRLPSSSSASASSSSSSSSTIMSAGQTVSACSDDTRFVVRGTPEAINGFSSVPCATCPVATTCSPGGQVSPEKCVYLDNWLTLF